MSKNEFDELLLKKLREADFEYNPASWEKLSALLPTAAPAADSSFDELLVKKLQEEEMEYKAEHWEQLAAMLPPALAPVSEPNKLIPGSTNKRWALAAGIAAALVLALGTAVFLKQINNTADTNDTTPAVVQNQQPQPKTIPTPQNNPSAVQQPATATYPNMSVPNSTGNLATQNKPGASHQQIQQTPQHVLNTLPANPLLPPTQQHPEQIAHNEIIPQPVMVQEPVVAPKVAIETPVNERRVPETYAYNRNSEVSAFYEGNGRENKNPKTSISLGGGVNYGNLNTGYTAGVTVRRKVAGDLFVDGTVAMMYNNNAANVAVNNGPSLNGTASRPSSFNETPLSSPALDPIQKLYYVQFNPSIGYQIEKHVALSVGGDFQQMLNKKEEIVQPESNNSKVFPNFDVGLTTKSEFSITPNIQAGLMYREGLNNLIKNDGSKYVNRRYVQVQFKYNIPVN